MLGPGGGGSSGAAAGLARRVSAGVKGGWEAAVLPSILACWGLGAGALLLVRARFGGTGGGGTGGVWGWKKGCVACWLGSCSVDSAGACMVALARLRVMSASFHMVSGGVCRPWQCEWALFEKVVEVVVPHGFCLHYPGLRGFRCVWTVGGWEYLADSPNDKSQTQSMCEIILAQ